MRPGCISRLKHALVSDQLNAAELCRFIKKRINSDRNAVCAGQSISDLKLPATNSIVSCPETLNVAPFSDTASLGGIPFLVKDNFCIANDNPTTCSSKSLANFKSPYTAPVVQSLLDAGGICVGKTNMDEFAMGSASIENALTGPVVNPWSKNPAELRIAGGSSGGSAAAVAAGLAPFALASDTGGSARHPASLCGVVGLKPTYGLASRSGMIPLVNSLDCPSVIAARVADVRQVICEWVVGARTQDATLTSPPGIRSIKDVFRENKVTQLIRIGIPAEYHAPGMSQEIAAIWDMVAGWLDDSDNCMVKSVKLPHVPIATAVYSVLCAVEVASNMARYDGLRYGLRAELSGNIRAELAKLDMDTSDGLMAASRQLGFGAEVRNRILAGNFFLLRGQRKKHLQAARRLWRLVKEDYDNVFNEVDFLLAPVNLRPAPLLKTFRQLDNRTRTSREDPCTVGVNLAGLPAVALPITLSTSERMPIGLQLIGRPWSELQLLSLAGFIEEKADFPLLVDLPNLLGVD